MLNILREHNILAEPFSVIMYPSFYKQKVTSLKEKKNITIVISLTVKHRLLLLLFIIILNLTYLYKIHFISLPEKNVILKNAFPKI